MKDLESQIEFIDKKLLPLFGIKSICDYETIIYLDDVEKKFDVAKLNNILQSLKDIFPVKDFNFHKTENKIISPKHAFNVLKICLDIALIPHDVNHKNKRKYMRLISSNIILYKYIMKNQTETSEKRHFAENINCEYSMKSTVSANTCKSYEYLTYETIEPNVKKENTVEFFFNVDSLYNKTRNDIRVNIKSLMMENVGIKNIKIEICSEKINNVDIVSHVFINKLLETTKFKLLNLQNDKGTELQFQQDTFIFPEKFIFPLSAINLHEFILSIETVPELKKITDILVLKMTVNTVEFYSNFNKKIQVSFIDIPMKNKNGLINNLRIMSGIWGFSHAEFYDPNNTNMTVYLNSDDEIDGEYINILNFKGFKLKKTENYLKNALKLIDDEQYDFVTFNTKVTEFRYYVQKVENTYRHIYDFLITKDKDTMSNISIVGQILQEINKDNITFGCKSGITNKLETFNCVMEKINKQTNNLVIISSEEGLYNNLLCSESLCLIINTKSINKPFEITNVEYYGYVWKIEHRCKFAQDGKTLIDFSVPIP